MFHLVRILYECLYTYIFVFIIVKYHRTIENSYKSDLSVYTVSNLKWEIVCVNKIF